MMGGISQVVHDYGFQQRIALNISIVDPLFVYFTLGNSCFLLLPVSISRDFPLALNKFQCFKLQVTQNVKAKACHCFETDNTCFC